MRLPFFRRSRLMAMSMVGATATAFAFLCVGCPADVGERCAQNACTPQSSLDGSEGGGSDSPNFPDVITPANCDVKADSTDPGSIPCVDNTYAVFVDPVGGNDTNDGSKEHPLATIGEALSKRQGKPRVYLCGEDPFKEHVELKSGLLLLGGFTCAGGAWTYGGTKSRIAPLDEGYALHIDGVADEVRIADVAFESIPGGVKAASSIAVFAANAGNVSFKRASLTSGAGAPGVTGIDGATRSNHSTTASGAVGTVGASCNCVDSTKSKGGNGAAAAGSGIEDGSATPTVGASNSGLSGALMCTDGTGGANGLANLSGAASTSNGKLTASGWDPTPTPSDAPNGNPAQGGGGGGAKTSSGGIAGGGGGCGGCGGTGGGVGGGGGSSFALLSFNSTIVVDSSTLHAGPGGKGGKGGPGENGQSGGAFAIGACNGGTGGIGAGGSGGGGGAGGHAVPVGFIGSEPTVTGGTTTFDLVGGGGDGGDPGQGGGNPGKAGTAGPEGKAQKSFAL